jgi:hypothetical protein
MNTTTHERTQRQVAHIIECIMSGERDYAQAFLPRHKRAALTIRRSTDYRPEDTGRLSIVDRAGWPFTYDVSDAEQLAAAIERLDAILARGGRVSVGNWVRSTTPARIYIDNTRRAW